MKDLERQLRSNPALLPIQERQHMGKKPHGLRFRWEQALRESDLTTKARHVGHLMATYANADGTKIDPGVTLLAKGAGMGIRTVHKALDELRSAGWVERVREGNSRSGQADEYRLVLPVQAATESPAQPASSSAPQAGSGARQSTPPDQAPDQVSTRSLPNQEALDAMWADVEREAEEKRRKKAEEEAAEEARIEELLKDAPGFD
jgi:DNA-binding transcriptional ArsR family regulator